MLGPRRVTLTTILLISFLNIPVLSQPQCEITVSLIPKKFEE